MERDDKTWLNLAYLVFGALVAYVSVKFLELIGAQFSLVDRFQWFSRVANIVSLLVAVATVWWVQAAAERHDFYLSAIGEVRKVAWPTVPQTKQMTLIVCVVVAIFSVILTVFDVIWVKILQFIIY